MTGTRITNKTQARKAIAEIRRLMKPYAETQDTAANLLKGCDHFERELISVDGYVTYGFASGMTYSSIALALDSARRNVDYYERDAATPPQPAPTRAARRRGGAAMSTQGRIELRPGCMVKVMDEWAIVELQRESWDIAAYNMVVPVCGGFSMQEIDDKGRTESCGKATVLLPDPRTLDDAAAVAAWDAHCTGEANFGPGRIWQLEDGYMTLHRKDDGPWYPVYWLWNDWQFGSGYVTPTNREMHERDMQKYAVAVAWWQAHARARGGEHG